MTARRRAAMAILAVALYSMCYAAITAGLRFAPPLRFAALRAMTAGLAILIIVVARRQPILPPHELRGGVVALALAGTVVGFAAMFLSPSFTGVGISSVLGNSTPLFVVVLAAVVLKEPITLTKGVALALGVAGVVVLSLRGGLGAGTYFAVSALVPLTAALGSAIESVIVKRLNLRHAFLRVAAWQLLIGSAALFGLSAVIEGSEQVHWTAEFVALVLLVGVFGTAIATSIWYWLLEHGEAGRLSLYLFLIPVLGLLFGWALFGERLGMQQIAGVGLILMGLVWATRDGMRGPHALPDVRPAAATDAP